MVNNGYPSLKGTSSFIIHPQQFKSKSFIFLPAPGNDLVILLMSISFYLAQV